MTPEELQALSDATEESAAFEEKFRPKRTTDDCYTPECVYDVVAGYVARTYNVDPGAFARPFYPGGDYEAYDYGGRIVVDNPPFSILTQIAAFYLERGIRFFLFAPGLTVMSSLGRLAGQMTAICLGVQVEYANGAKVSTSFLTNLETEYVCRSDPDLYRELKMAQQAEKAKKAGLPHYEYPPNLLTATMVNAYSKHGLPFAVPMQQGRFVRTLDAQRQEGKSIYGGGYPDI